MNIYEFCVRAILKCAFSHFCLSLSVSFRSHWNFFIAVFHFGGNFGRWTQRKHIFPQADVHQQVDLKHWKNIVANRTIWILHCIYSCAKHGCVFPSGRHPRHFDEIWNEKLTLPDKCKLLMSLGPLSFNQSIFFRPCSKKERERVFCENTHSCLSERKRSVLLKSPDSLTPTSKRATMFGLKIEDEMRKKASARWVKAKLICIFGRFEASQRWLSGEFVKAEQIRANIAWQYRWHR